MPCHHFITLKIDDYLAGRLKPDDKNHFDDIIGKCPRCRGFLEEQRAVYDLMRAVPSPEIPGSYWSGLEKSIFARLENNEEEPVVEIVNDNDRARNIWNILIPLAASFLIFLVSLTMGDRPTMPTATEIMAVSEIDESRPEQTSYARLIESQELLAISYITTSPPGTFGF